MLGNVFKHAAREYLKPCIQHYGLKDEILAGCENQVEEESSRAQEATERTNEWPPFQKSRR